LRQMSLKSHRNLLREQQIVERVEAAPSPRDFSPITETPSEFDF